ncbi:Amuc_1100 family pilus-like protein [Pelagicoccus sp. SDUM812005]|uniref:Amuc_1100 family pilus-like protein n=1 Tax=Pelagicoccus sp. SDUM812005 TaxID=3041257 RepID=UPI00280CAC6D|nr:Amuc_1100 family pilus-like protein [Pelagicoccus sp. SDUM812005]MDQ8180039.1 Amuc_1100 family pilus-like protein [Pelagicoccus sp. SDUM812005]
MTFFRKNPVFYSMLFVLLGTCGAGLWYLAQLSSELKELKTAYETKASQYDRYVSAKPSPTRSNLEAIDANYDELYEVYEKALGILKLNTFDDDSFFGTTPQSRADWSFELHRYKENARYAALSNSIALPEESEFGVKEFSNSVPSAERMERVHQEIVIMASLLETLFDSGIKSFETIQRGIKPQKGKALVSSRAPANRLFTEGDYFTVEPGQSIAVPGTLDSYVFRVAFRGQSIALRSFLNRISNSPLPFVVRGVEADLSSEGGEKQGLESIAENPFAERERKARSRPSAVPIISDNTSLFAVTIEFLQLAVEIEKPRLASVEKGGGDA